MINIKQAYREMFKETSNLNGIHNYFVVIIITTVFFPSGLLTINLFNT